jgi:ribosomal protein L9
MKVILLKDIKKQGKKGDIKEFANGFAQFLIKNGDAVSATSGSVTRLVKENEERALDEALEIKEFNKQKEKLEKLKIKIKVKTGNMDRVFGNVSSKQIATELDKLGFKIDKKKIKITHDLNCLGFHDVKLELHKKVIANLKIELVKER